MDWADWSMGGMIILAVVLILIAAHYAEGRRGGGK